MPFQTLWVPQLHEGLIVAHSALFTAVSIQQGNLRPSRPQRQLGFIKQIPSPFIHENICFLSHDFHISYGHSVSEALHQASSETALQLVFPTS